MNTLKEFQKLNEEKSLRRRIEILRKFNQHSPYFVLLWTEIDEEIPLSSKIFWAEQGNYLLFKRIYESLSEVEKMSTYYSQEKNKAKEQMAILLLNDPAISEIFKEEVKKELNLLPVC